MQDKIAVGISMGSVMRKRLDECSLIPTLGRSGVVRLALEKFLSQWERQDSIKFNGKHKPAHK